VAIRIMDPDMVRMWIRILITTLVRCALVDVCTVSVLLVLVVLVIIRSWLWKSFLLYLQF